MYYIYAYMRSGTTIAAAKNMQKNHQRHVSAIQFRTLYTYVYVVHVAAAAMAPKKRRRAAA